jgi:hypothetical protein
MRGNENAIKSTLENPEYIYQSTRKLLGVVYFAKTAESTYPQLYTSVVVHLDGNNNGKVVTAYFTQTIRPGIKKGGLLYERV